MEKTPSYNNNKNQPTKGKKNSKRLQLQFFPSINNIKSKYTP